MSGPRGARGPNDFEPEDEWDAVTNDEETEDYDCPTFQHFGACRCSTGIGWELCPNQYVGRPRHKQHPDGYDKENDR